MGISKYKVDGNKKVNLKFIDLRCIDNWKVNDIICEIQR